MYNLNRRQGEVITIGDNVRITVLETRRGHVKLGIEAPPDIRIRRAEADTTTITFTHFQRTETPNAIG